MHIQSTQIYLSGDASVGFALDIDGYDHLGFIGASEPKLNGTYTIGTSGYYSSITEALNILYGWNQIFGPVTYNILDGTYNEQIDLTGAILGSSSSKYITFQSNSGNAADVELTHTASSGSGNYVVKVTTAEYIKFKNLTLTAGGTDFAKVVFLEDVTGNLEFYGNIMNGYEITSGGSTEQAIIHCDNGKLNNTTFENNTLNNGVHGINLVLSSSPPKSSNLRIIGNNILTQKETLQVKNADAPVIKSNILSNISGYSVGLNFCSNNFLFEKNQIDGALGIQVYACTGTSSSKGIIKNNFISVKDDGMKIYGSTYIDILFNNINIENIISNNVSKALYVLHLPSVSTTNILVKNNITHNNIDGYAIDLPHGTSLLTECNYNNLYTTGTNLVKSSGTDYTTLASWQTASSLDANSYNKEVTFVSPSDLHIASSPIHLDGTTISGITEDIDGDTRNNPPFIGADEYIAPLSGVYTIGTGGDYETITDAINGLYLGGVSGAVIFKLLNGTYTEQINLDGAITGSSTTNTVTFESNSSNASDVVVTYTASGTADNFVVRINETEHIKFRNLTLTAGGTDYAKVVSLENVTGNLDFYGNVMNGYEITSGSSDEQIIVLCDDNSKLNNTTFENNILNNGSDGIHLSLYNYSKTTNLQIIGNTISCKNTCFNIKNADAPKIVSNILTTTSQNDKAIVLSLCTNSLVIEKNLIKSARGIYLLRCFGSPTNYALIANNIITSNRNAIHIEGSKFINIYYNTMRCLGNSQFSITALKIVHYSQVSTTTEEVNIINNIIYNCCGKYSIVADHGTITDCNYNNLFTAGTASNFLAKYGSNDYATLADWQAAPEGFDANSYSEDVTFVSPTDLHIVSTPVPLNGTTIASITTDIDGETRGTPPFIGADEPNGIYVSVKVMLEGPYNTPEMNASLTLPIASPYNSETVTSIPNIIGNEVVDWVLVELRDENNSSSVLESRSAFVLQDGSVVDLDGVSPVHFTSPSGNYFVSVKHRNHLAVMSESAIGL